MKYATSKPRTKSVRGLLLCAIFILGGCAGLPPDNGRGEVDQLLIDRGRSVDDATSDLLASLVGAPLTPDSAIRIALINNPALQSTYASLGFGAADVYEAGRIRNPVLGASVLSSSRSDERDQVTFGLVTSFTDLITLPARTRLAEGTFAALQQAIGAEVLNVAAQTEQAYYDYVGAQQVAALRAQIAKAGALSANLATRYQEAGNLTPRELALERAAASQTQLVALEAQAAAYAARTTLAQMLGLSVADNWTVPAQLPLPVVQEDGLEALLSLAQESRLDLAAARVQAGVRADQLGVVGWTRWLGELDIGFEKERESGGGSLSGPSLALEVPLFNQHEDALVRADTELQIALNEVRRITTDVDNSVRLAYARLDNSRARITEYQEVMIPQRIATVAAAQQEASYMLIGTFELIALKQDEYDAYQGYLEAIRDYWLARTDLGLATGTALPSNAHIGEQWIGVEQFTAPAAGGMDHSANGAMGNGSTMKGMKGMEGMDSMPMDHSGHMMMDSNTTNEPGHTMSDEMNNGGSK